MAGFLPFMPILGTNLVDAPKPAKYLPLPFGRINPEEALGPHAMNLDAIPRPEVEAACYRKLEAIAMQLVLQLPHDDIGKCLIIRDIFENVIKRWAADERMAQHQPAKAIADEINKGNLIRLVSGDY